MKIMCKILEHYLKKSVKTLSYVFCDPKLFARSCKFSKNDSSPRRSQDEGINPDVMLFSLIALEKFAQTSENKATIKVGIVEV